MMRQDWALTLLAVSWLRRLHVGVLLMVRPHGWVERLSSHDWRWRQFLLLQRALAPRSPLLRGKKMGLQVRHNIRTALTERRSRTTLLVLIGGEIVQKKTKQKKKFTHLFGLHVVRRRRVRDGRVLGKLRGMRHERGGVVPHVTCAQRRGGVSQPASREADQFDFLPVLSTLPSSILSDSPVL